MSDENAPVCQQHDGDVPMRLASLHSDASRPGVLGLYECPECGHERRLPFGSAA